MLSQIDIVKRIGLDFYTAGFCVRMKDGLELGVIVWKVSAEVCLKLEEISNA